jgi:uncharacterized protein (TIGR02996 family)
MLEREPFLKAIFAAPDDDLPRLVFADWLDEHGETAWAELIRVQCETCRTGGESPRTAALVATVFGGYDECLPVAADFDRGFRSDSRIRVTAEQLADPEGFRSTAVSRYPEWYGASSLTVTEGPIVTPTPLVTVLTSPVTEHVTELDLSGREEEVPTADDDPAMTALGIKLIDFVRRPTINTLMVEELAGMRECRRLVSLDLRNNDIGNDALRALAESPYFTRLTKLRLSEGNRYRGRVWQRVVERFRDIVE